MHQKIQCVHMYHAPPRASSHVICNSSKHLPSPCARRVCTQEGSINTKSIQIFRIPKTKWLTDGATPPLLQPPHQSQATFKESTDPIERRTDTTVRLLQLHLVSAPLFRGGQPAKQPNNQVRWRRALDVTGAMLPPPLTPTQI